MNTDSKPIPSDSEAGSDVGLRLRMLRGLAGLSQRELAKRAGVTNSTISTVEQGLVSPSIHSLQRILVAFPITLSDFFAFNLEPVLSRSESTVPSGVELLGLAANSSEPYRVATVDLRGVLVVGELLLLSPFTSHSLKSGDCFQVNAGCLYALANRSSTEARYFVCPVPSAI